MQAQRALLNFTESERKLGDRLLGIAMEIDRVEGYSEPHAVVMAVLADKLALRLGVHGMDLTALKYAALVHDLGERVMKRNYLLRPDEITREEILDLWRHPILGEQAAAEIGLPRHSQLLIRWHHEWWNGLGYPDGLAGQAIPVGARILRLVDTYYALRSNRPHRVAYTEEEAIQVIIDRAGLEFDPDLVRVFLTIRLEERLVRQPEPQPIVQDADTFTILTPEGLQTAVVPHQDSEDIPEEAPIVDESSFREAQAVVDELPAEPLSTGDFTDSGPSEEAAESPVIESVDTPGGDLPTALLPQRDSEPTETAEQGARPADSSERNEG